MKDTIFREYDIRGIVNDELIIDDVYDLGRAIAFYLVQLNDKVQTVAVGMDGRESSPAIKNNLCRALTESGLDVVFVGVCTSPMIYFATHTMPVDAAIMITASHNPKIYNGFKICLGTQSLWGAQIKEIGALYKQKKHRLIDIDGNYTEHSIKDDYIAWHVKQFAHLHGNDIAAVIDCGNGAAGVVMPELVAQMGWRNVQLLFTEVDGTFPNHTADPTNINNMQDVLHALQTTDASVGIGFDGDADRMGAMTKSGELVSGDKLLALFAQSMIQQYPGMAVVYNVVCSDGLTELLKKWGAQAVITPVGHSIIEENMHTHHAMLGGETSCHFFFKDRHFGYDDGIYAMLRLLELLIQTQKSLAELLTMFPHKVTTPEFRIPCKEEDKYRIVAEIKDMFMQQKGVKLLTIDGVRVTTDHGWGIIRASNTQPVLSVRCEADTVENLLHIKEDFAAVLAHYFDNAYVREQLQMNE